MKDLIDIIPEVILHKPYSYRRVLKLCWWHSFSYIYYDGDIILAVDNKDAKAITNALNGAYTLGFVGSYMYNNN
jgi:hypothetical protein